MKNYVLQLCLTVAGAEAAKCGRNQASRPHFAGFAMVLPSGLATEKFIF
ncbi:hypothetical protein [Pasteurella testudinis]